MDIEMIDETKMVSQSLLETLDSLLQLAANRLDKTKAEMSLTFVNNHRSHELNHYYRQVDRPTDVISLEYQEENSFSFSDDELSANPELLDIVNQMNAYLGELYISLDKAKEQAEAYGHSLERELGFLAVHGFLHINGYDHQTPEDEAEMFGLQEEILSSYGLTR